MSEPLVTLPTHQPISQPVVRPLALLDLDDTLFQTAKHVPAQPQAHQQLRHVATLDIHGQPLSWMTDRQWQFWHWLQHSSDMIAVTARSVDGLARVQLPLSSSWAVCQHGAVILQPDQQSHQQPSQRPHAAWWAHMQQQLQPIQAELQQALADVLADVPDYPELRARIACEYGQPIYLVVKQSKQPEHAYFARLIARFQHNRSFYIHINGNTLALLPCCVSKRAAVQFLLSQIDPDNQRVRLGWGDSLSDVGFLQQCDWWGMPQRSQASAWISQQLDDYVEQTGAYDFAGR